MCGTIVEQSLRQADLRLYIVDGNAAKPVRLQSDDNSQAELLVLNKSDLAKHADWNAVEGLRISCLTGQGLPELEQSIVDRITVANLQPENTVAINARHRECLRRALTSCERAGEALGQQIALEYIVVDLKAALQAIGEIIGSVDVEQVLDSVFGQFCIGK